MRSDNEHINLAGNSYRELRLLEEVSRAPESSQRRLASHLGVALGVTNVLIKSLARKGYIRIVRVRWRSWVYVLTPSGIARKVQLTFAYVENFLDHYRRIREILQEEIAALTLEPDSRVAIYGQTELGELAFIVFRNMGVTEIDFIDRTSDGDRFLGFPVRSFDSVNIDEYHKIVVAYQSDIEGRCRDVMNIGASASQIVPLLHEIELTTIERSKNRSTE